jgi:hypothetical protein
MMNTGDESRTDSMQKPAHWSKAPRIEVAIPVKENVRQMIVISAAHVGKSPAADYSFDLAASYPSLYRRKPGRPAFTHLCLLAEDRSAPTSDAAPQIKSATSVG